MQERTSLPEKRGNHSLRAILDGSPAPPHPKSSAAEGRRRLAGEEDREGELRASIRSGGGSQVRRACSGGRIAGGRRRERERRRRWRGGGIFGGLDSDTLLLCSCSSTAAWAVGSQNHTIWNGRPRLRACLAGSCRAQRGPRLAYLGNICKRK